MRLVNVHELLHLVRVIWFLHSPLDVLDKVLDFVLLSLGHDLGLFGLELQVADCVFFSLHVLFHLSETFGLHLKQFLQIVQILLQTLNLLLFGLQTGLHFKGTMR